MHETKEENTQKLFNSPFGEMPLHWTVVDLESACVKVKMKIGKSVYHTLKNIIT